MQDKAVIHNQPLNVVPSGTTTKEVKLPDSSKTEISVTCRSTDKKLPFFATLLGPDGKPVDPTGRGLYTGGRFAADGGFETAAAPGKVKLAIQAGPNYIPLETEAIVKPGYRTEVHVNLTRWFSPESLGWYGGDNHVHASHDPSGGIKTDVEYMSLLARANGLSFVTQNSSEFPFEDHIRLSTQDFHLRRSLENRQGSFSGHLNSPGIEMPYDVREKTMHAPMPAIAATEWVRERGAAMIHTHTMVPAHQLHWMGATEAYSYGVLGGTIPDAMDIDGEASEHLWYTVLNLGNRIAASGSTDAALERVWSPAPGARRMYVKSPKSDYAEFVKEIRAGRTIATNAGPLFAFMTIGGKGVSETIDAGTHELKVEVQSLYPLEEVYLVRSGVRVRVYEVRGKSGLTTITHPVTDEGDAWYVVKAKDTKGSWAITSPVYIKGKTPTPRPFSASLVLEIGNFTRLSEVRKEFMAHLIATVAPEDPLVKVELLRDDKVVKDLEPAAGNQVVDNKTPVTETFGEYKEGWLWHPQPSKAVRLQADIDVTETGWYSVRATTRSGRIAVSDAILWDAKSPVSSATSVANVFGKEILLRHWGYGASAPLANLDNGDYWWYPDDTYFRMETKFGGAEWHVDSGNEPRSRSFRPSGQLSKS